MINQSDMMLFIKSNVSVSLSLVFFIKPLQSSSQKSTYSTLSPVIWLEAKKSPYMYMNCSSSRLLSKVFHSPRISLSKWENRHSEKWDRRFSRSCTHIYTRTKSKMEKERQSARAKDRYKKLASSSW